MSQSLVSQISAVSPLGEAIDGAPRPKPRRERKPPREPLDRSLTFFCSNPQCDHGTWSSVEQARHMAREFWNLAQAIVRLAPDSPEALKLTGDIVLRELSDEDCRDAVRDYDQIRRQDGTPTVPMGTWLRAQEYNRRVRAGTLSVLTDEERASRRRDRKAAAFAEWEALSDEEVRGAGVLAALLRAKKRPVPEDVRVVVREYHRRLRDGRLKPLTPQEVAERRHARFVAGRTAWTDEEVRSAHIEDGRLRRQGVPIPDEIRQKANECKRRIRVGQMERLSYAERGALVAEARGGAPVAERLKLLPPPSELKARREGLGLSRPALASKIGVSVGTVENWEYGKVVPSLARIGPYLKALGIPAAGDIKERRAS